MRTPSAEQRRKSQEDHTGTRASRPEGPEPRLPHERDESSDSQQQQGQDERMKKAAQDVAQGQVDTGRSPVNQELAREHFPPEAGD